MLISGSDNLSQMFCWSRCKMLPAETLKPAGCYNINNYTQKPKLSWNILVPYERMSVNITCIFVPLLLTQGCNTVSFFFFNVFKHICAVATPVKSLKHTPQLTTLSFTVIQQLQMMLLFWSDITASWGFRVWGMAGLWSQPQLECTPCIQRLTSFIMMYHFTKDQDELCGRGGI